MALKILWLCSWYPNDTDPFDGDFIQRQALAVSTIHSIDVLHVHKQLKSKGPAHYQKNEINTNFTEHIFYNRIRKRNFLFNIYGIIKYFFIHTRFIRKNKRPDLIHVQVPMKSGIIALFYKWFYRIPYILTEHNGYYNSYLPDNFSKKSFLYRAITRSVIKHASVFTTVSKSLGEDINTWVLKKEFKVIPNVVDTRLFRFIPKDIKDRFQFIHISNMVPLKNVKGIIEATEELWKLRQDFKVVFVGDLNQEYYEFAGSKNLLNNVIFFEGVVSYETVAAKIQESDSMIIFSDSESQSCVVLEALCCGKPCIVTNTGGVKELIVDGINGFKVSIRDSNDLTNKMNKMIGDYDTFNQVQISENASAIYSYEVVGKQFSDCYKTVGK